LSNSATTDQRHRGARSRAGVDPTDADAVRQRLHVAADLASSVQARQSSVQQSATGPDWSVMSDSDE
jgi:hypothetical protein